MDTGLFFGLRFYEHEDGEPELSFNREECREFTHMEYVCLHSNSRIPRFGFRIKGTDIGFAWQSVDMGIYCFGDKLADVHLTQADWKTWEYNGYTYIYYIGVNVPDFMSDIAPGVYRFKIQFEASGIKKYYSDPFRVTKFIEEGDVPVYYVTFKVTDEVTSDNIQGATVEFNDTMGGQWETKTTDSNGEAVFLSRGFEAIGEYIYRVSRTGYNSSGITLYPMGEGDISIDVQLTPEAEEPSYRTYDGTNLRKHSADENDLRIWEE